MNNDIFNFFHELSLIPFIGKLAFFISYPFAYGVVALLIIWAIFLSKRKMFNFSLLFLSCFFSWVMSSTLKMIFQVSRPTFDLNIFTMYKETSFSFPSEHTAIFTAIAVSMFLINKKMGVLFSIIALLVGFSRIVLGAHYPVDILGGFVVGLIISLIFREIFKKI